MKIVRFRLKAFRGIEACEIVPKGGHVKISGRNGAGKSSTTLGILHCLANRGTTQPVRSGEEESIVEVDVGDYTFRRRNFADGRAAEFVGKAKPGKTMPSTPAKFLASLIGTGLALDPMAIFRMDEKTQRASILASLKIDVSAEDREIASTYQRRTEINGLKKAAESRIAELEAAGADASAPPPVPASDRIKEIAALQQRSRTEMARLAELKQLEEGVARLRASLLEAESRLNAAKDRPADMTVEDELEAAQRSLADIEKANAAGRSGQELAMKREEFEAAETSAKMLTARLDELAKAKASKVAAAATALELDGLGIDDELGVQLDGVRIAELNTAARCRLGLALAAASDPPLRTAIIDDASSFDNEGLEELFRWGQDKDMQLIVATVDPEGGDLEIEIVDGEAESAG